MKRILIIIILHLIMLGPLFAEKKQQDKEISRINLSTEELEGKAKAGLALGYPFGLTIGYKLANYLEINAFAGTHAGDFTLGSSLLFTLVTVEIKDEEFPLSVGPAVFCSFSDNFSMMAGAAVRCEYTFREIPLNLYLEVIPGLTLDKDLDFYLASSLGVRYVF